MSAVNSSPSKKTPVSPWKKPNEVMALHRLKIKKRALQARINCKSTTPVNHDLPKENLTLDKKRRNPFARSSEAKRLKEDNLPSEDISNDDNILFKLLNINNCNLTVKPDQIPKELPNIANTLTELSKRETIPEAIPGYTFIPIDWTLKTKMRIISQNKFKWSCKLRTSQEASGITGFVRCLDTTGSQSLDTSMSARCYQCCLVWQHPSLPWLQLFPRNGKISSNNSNFVNNNPDVAKALYRDWAESFRSLFQLIRAKQCPYFYLCANTFTVLFRAAGICGFNETHALLTPTTRGFREVLKQEDIEFTMPLKQRRSTISSEDLGYETLDSTVSDDSPNSKSSIFRESENVDFVDVDEDDENITSDQWLRSLGIDAAEIKKINNQQVRKHQAAECTIDNSEQSLICVEGVEAQALFNFLINCKSAISITGALAGVPPTLLAPVSFLGATLQSLKIREGKVTVDEGEYHSMEICGPILPHTIHLLAALIASPDDEYSVTFANIESTSSFSKVNVKNKDDSTNSDKEGSSVVFGQENLADCGLPSKLIKHFCSSGPQHVQRVESLKFTGKEQLYSWK